MPTPAAEPASPVAPEPRRTVRSLPTYRPGRSLPGAIKLSSNELPFGPLPSVSAAMAAAAGEAQRYPDYLATELRRALGAHLGVDPERVATGAGAVGLLQQLSIAYLRPGDEVIFGDPSFEAYRIFTDLCEAEAVAIPLRRMAMDVDAMVAAISARTRLALLANPNNPTGTAIPAAAVRRLAEALPAGALLVVDEAYREFCTGRHLASALDMDGEHPQVVVLRTFSKAHGLAALRVGYLVADPDVVAAVDRVLIPFSVGSVGQAAATASLGASAELAERVSSVLAARSRMAGGLRRLGWSVPDPQANFVWLPAGAATDDLAAGLIQTGVVARAFTGVGVRVTVGSEDSVDAFLAAFEHVAAAPGADKLAAAWGLPAGAEALRVLRWLDRLAAVEGRLIDLSGRGRMPGLAQPDPGGTERWDAGQIWAHVGEIGGYWTDQLELVADEAAVSTGPVPFGRVKSDPARIAAVAGGRNLEPATHVHAMLAAMDRLRDVLAGMSTTDWTRVGRHSTLGVMDVDAIVEEFLVGHWEQHAAQLETLGD